MNTHKKTLLILILALLFCLLTSSCNFSGTKENVEMKNIVIFGDSYSTFEGEIPQGYAAYYPAHGVNKAKDTWWSLYADKTDGNILLNDSWSGSTIGYTGYGNSDCSHTNSFIYRYRKHKEAGFFENNEVDTVFVFGGTNDSWSGAPLGELKFSDWEESDLFNVLPAICHFAYTLTTDLPDARIVFISNTDITPEIQDCFKIVAEKYNAEFIQLSDIEKEEGHPNKKGMRSICDQLIKALQ